MELLDFTHTWVWYLSLIIFIVSYYFIAREEAYHLNKAKPALFAGTSMFIIIWIYFVLNWLDTQLLKLETENFQMYGDLKEFIIQNTQHKSQLN